MLHAFDCLRDLCRPAGITRIVCGCQVRHERIHGGKRESGDTIHIPQDRESLVNMYRVAVFHRIPNAVLKAIASRLA